MRFRLIVPAAAVVLAAGCSGGGSATPTPTPTQTAAEVSPTASVPATPPQPSSAPSAPAATVTETATETATQVEVVRPGVPRDLVVAFVEAVAEGDAQTSFGLLTPGGQEGIGGLEGWSAALPEYTEGLGAYAAAPDLEVREIGLDEAATTVVELLGTVTREGSTEFDVAALTVRAIEGDELGLDLFTDFEPIGINDPQPGVVPPQPEFSVGIFGGFGLVLLLDGQQVEGELMGANVSGRVYTPPEPLAPGYHTLTVVAYNDRVDAVDARAEAYEVEG